ncbi:protein kinase domain-containing protein [Cuniculiplasma sp. SKW4]|uniref:protein kinase domain-containing protein n=1 Tax=Cuniculiplasma sp. SKW4 TaxID=3400171 RepID=UPI003FCF6918
MQARRLTIRKILPDGREISNFIRLGEKIHSGGEGEIYEVIGQPEKFAKIYADGSLENKRLRKLRMEKIRKMIIKPPERMDGLAWPESILYEGHPEPENFVGFTMKRFEDMQMLENVYTTETRTELIMESGWIGLRMWSSLFMIALNLSIIMEDIWKKGYIIPDLSPSNILVDRDMRVALIDCDSFIIRGENDFGRIVGNPEYTAPERLSMNKMGNVDDVSWRFSFAVLIFRILMLGYHPFRGIFKDNPEYTETDNIKKGNSPYFGGNGTRQFGSPSEFTIPDPIKPLFIRAFVYGLKSPMVRPDFTEWRKALQKIYELRHEDFHICHNSNTHIYYENNMNLCPWCLMMEEWNIEDPFPDGRDIKVTGDSRVN